MDASDGELVARALAGERAAFGALIERHRPPVLRLALRMLGDSAEAEDAAQEACLHAFLSLSRLRDPARFGAWLGGIVVNLCRMKLRARRITSLPEDWDGGRAARGFTWAETQPSPEAICEIRELHHRVQSAIALLPPEQQAVVRLHYLAGLTLAEIGVIAGAPLGTVKARLHRARERLRAGLVGQAGAQAIRKENTGMIEVEVQNVVMRAPKLPAELGEKEVRLPLPPGFAPEADIIFFRGNEAGAQPFTKPLPPSFAHRVVVLREKGGARVLPIWIGPHEADMIALQLAGNTAPRPLTFDLILRLLEAVKGSIERVTVNRLHDEVFYAVIALRAGGQTHEVDARPSDALNLALRAHAPIFVDEEVMGTAGVVAEKLEEKLNEYKPGAPDEGPVEPVQFVWVSDPPPDLNPHRRELPEEK